MFATRRLLVLGVLVSMPAFGANEAATGVRAEGQTLWPLSGSVGSARIEPVLGPSVPTPAELDSATLLGLERLRRWMARDGIHPQGPPLKYIVPVEGEAPAMSNMSRVAYADPKATGPLTLFTNTNPTSTVPGGFSSTTNEPSAATKGDRIFYTMNWWVAQSTNGGGSYSSLDPFTSPFAPVNAGFCCDQVTIYDRHTDTLFYLQQYIEDGTTGTQRINVDQGFDGSFECFYDFTPADVGQGSGKWFDFPDMALSNGFLFHSTNIFTTPGNAFAGAVVMRYPVADIAACGGFSYFFYFDSGFGAFRFSQGATDTMYFASHISNASTRIWRWRDSESSLTTFDRSVTTWSDATRVCPGPDGRDWCGFLDGRITGGMLANNVVGFMWTAAQDGSFAFPQVRVARWDTANTMALVDEPVVWSSGNAWAYPTAAVNDRGEAGGTVMAGGGSTLYPSCFAWIADEQNGSVMAPLENQASILGTIGPSTNRSGDYLSARAHFPNQSVFSGTCFAYNSTTAATSRHTLFGRSSLGNALFRNGFETGNTGVWSSTQP